MNLLLLITYFLFFKIPRCSSSLELEERKWLNSYLEQQSFADRLLQRKKTFKRNSGKFLLELNEYIVHSHETESALFFTISDVVYLLLDKAIYTLSWEKGHFSLQFKNITLDGIGTEKVDFLRAFCDSITHLLELSQKNQVNTKNTPLQIWYRATHVRVLRNVAPLHLADIIVKCKVADDYKDVGKELQVRILMWQLIKIPSIKKATQVDNADLILLGFESGNTQIYDLTNEKILQTMDVSVDANFFENNKHSYLILLTIKENDMTELIIYKWQDSHFVNIETNFTIAAVKIASFSAGKSEILMVLQTHAANKTIDIFEFHGEKLNLLQNLPVDDPVNLDSFTDGYNQYLVVYEKNRNSTLYQWNGKQFETEYTILTETEISNSVMLNFRHSTLVFSKKQNSVEIYQVIPEIDHVQTPKNYTLNSSMIFDISSDRNELIFVVGLKEDGEIVIAVLLFTFNTFDTPVLKNTKKENLKECFNNLEEKVYDLKKILNGFQAEAVEVIDQMDGENVILSESLTQEDDLEKEINEVLGRVEYLTSLLDLQNQLSETTNKTISKPVILKGSIKVNKFIGQDIQLEEVNSKKWTPEEWLRYKDNQTITGPVKIASLVTDELESSPGDPTFENLVLINEKNIFSGKISMSSLTANNIFVNTINDMRVEDVYLKSNPEMIKGLKTFQNLNAITAEIAVLNKKEIMPNILEKNITFGNNIVIENLEVERIEGVPWNDFRNSVFRASETDTIVGNLEMPTLKTISLKLKTLNNVTVDNFFTLSTNQTIDSNITFQRVYAENIDSSLTNGIGLGKSAVMADEDVPIKGPVTLKKMSVAKNLRLFGNADTGFLIRNGGRILGTNEFDFLQIYHNVKLKGNLFLKDFTLNPKAKLFLSQEEMPYNFTETYWSKSKKQIIPVRVHIQDSLSVSHLITNMLNDIKISQFMSENNDQEFETEYAFENVTIFGNVILNNDATHKPDLNDLNKEAVKTNGSFMIHGKKTYEGTLRCENLVVNELEGIKTLDTLKRNVVSSMKGQIYFSNIIIKGNVEASLNRLDKISGRSIMEFLNSVVLLDEPQDLGFLNFNHLKANNLQVATYNDQPMEELMAKKKQPNNISKIDNLIIDGNVTIKNAKDVLKINDILFADIVQKSQQNVGAEGGVPFDLIFNGSIEIDNLVTFVINDVYLPNLTSRFLYRDLNQIITAPYSFQRIKAENIMTPRINKNTMQNLIDVSKEDLQVLYVPMGLTFSEVKILKSLHAKNLSPCNLEDLLENIHSPSRRKWKTMKIFGNVSLLDEENPLYRVFEKTVKMNEENDIVATINFENILVENLETNQNISGVNISEIFEDAVLSNSTSEQIIAGRKWYDNLEVSDAVVLKNADIAIVNGEDIRSFTDDIVDKTSKDVAIVKGMKTFFSGLQVDNLITPSIMGINPLDIVTTPTDETIPEAVFERIKVDNNFNVTFLNNLNFAEILENRLLINGPSNQVCDGIYFFDNLEIKNITTPAINKIRISNLVFDDGTVQNITGPKEFMNDVTVLGDLKVELFNGFNIIKELTNKLQDNEGNVTINGNLAFLKPTIIKGNISAEYINGFPIATLQEIFKNTNTKAEVEDITALRDKLVQTIGKNLRSAQTPVQEYMYLEESKDLQIPAKSAIVATTLKTKDYVHLQLTGEESGEYCGLPKACKCPFQNTIIVSPELSVSKLAEKGSQRIFSYDDQLMTVHFITNSVSMSVDCRTDTKVKNEVSMMSWITTSTGNSTAKFHKYPDFFTGYIRKVEFFTFKNTTYVIVGRYYDPLMDNYDLNCTVIRFNENRSNAEVIQYIPTRGLQEVYIFYTAQGIRLVIGNIKEDEESTQIYTFNPETQKFDFLRDIPYFGCSSATGIIMETDSFIALKQSNALVYILKYIPQFDNYYHFQTLDINEQVSGVSVFYAGDYGISDAYLCLVTSSEKYFIYSYRHMGGFKLHSNGLLEGLKNLVPVDIGSQNYFIALSAKSGSLFKIIKNGSS